LSSSLGQKSFPQASQQHYRGAGYGFIPGCCYQEQATKFELNDGG